MRQNTEEPSLNIRELLIISLGSSEKIGKDIDKLYEEDSHTYYRIYRESGFVDDVFFALYPTEQAARMRKVVGIIEKAYNEDSMQVIFTLIRKSHSTIYRYIKNADVVDERHLWKLFLKGGKTGEEVSEKELGNMVVIASYLLTTMKKPFKPMGALETWLNKWFNFLVQQTRDSFVIPENMVENQAEAVRGYMKDYRVKESNYHIDNVLDNRIEWEISSRIAEKGYRIPFPQEVYDKERKEAFRAGKDSSLIGFYSGMLKGFGISEFIYADLMTKKEYEVMFARYADLVKSNHIPEESQSAAMIASIYMAGLAKEYLNTREAILKESEEAAFYEQEKITNQYEKKLQKTKESERNMTIQFVGQQERVESMEKTIQTLKKEVERQQQELDKRSEQDKEIQALREYVFSLQADESAEEDNEESLEELTKGKKVVIIGGNLNWQKKVKEAYPTFSFISGDSKNANLSPLNKKNTLVFFNTSSNSHGLYYRVVKEMAKNENPLFYLNESGSLERTERAIRRALKN